MRKYKFYVQKNNQPENPIVQGYIVEEFMLFCSKCLHDIETKFNQFVRNGDALGADVP